MKQDVPPRHPVLARRTGVTGRDPSSRTPHASRSLRWQPPSQSLFSAACLASPVAAILDAEALAPLSLYDISRFLISVSVRLALGSSRPTRGRFPPPEPIRVTLLQLGDLPVSKASIRSRPSYAPFGIVIVAAERDSYPQVDAERILLAKGAR